jgi:hypothetical protein
MMLKIRPQRGRLDCEGVGPTGELQPRIMKASTQSEANGRRGLLPAILLSAICACVLAGILVAGLWPFHAPLNDVRWLGASNGLSFGKNGSIVSAGLFGTNPSQAGNSCTLEIWLEPHRVDYAGTILAFYQPTDRSTSFSLRQSLGDLKLERRAQDESPKKAKMFVDVFSSLKPVFVTVSSGESGVAIYADGILVRKSSNFKVASSDLTGTLVIGNAPSTADSWSGRVRALAVYDREFLAPEVSQHFLDWTKGKQPVTSDVAIASYRFDEGKGNVVHSRVPSAPNLLIPERFFVLNQQFLEPPWDEFFPGWNYWEDVAINIGGFIPLGLCFGAYFSAIKRIKRATWLTIPFGFAVSLTIEVLQSLLPTRNSGMTDLFTNTFGTALGALMWSWRAKHNWFTLGSSSSIVPTKN